MKKRRNASKGNNLPVRQAKDVSNRNILKDPTLCSQFLKDYVDSELFKDLRPEDIEDVSEKYQAYLGITFETDTVKKICMRGKENEDEMSLLMMLGKAQTPEDIHRLIHAQKDKVDLIVRRAPEHVLEIIAVTVWSLCMKMNVP